MRRQSSRGQDPTAVARRFLLGSLNGIALAAAAAQAMALGEALATTARSATGFATIYSAARQAALSAAPYSLPSSAPSTLGALAAPFALPPAALLLLRPLVLGHYDAARSAWTGVQLVALALALGLLVHQSGLRWPRHVPAVFALLVVLFPPVRAALLLGDLSPVLLALLAGAWALARLGRHVRAGLFLGLAGAVSPALLALAVPWLAWRLWRGPAVALGAALGLNAVAAVVLAPGAAQGYLALLPALAPHWLARPENVGLPSLWLRLTTSGPGRVPWLDAPALGAALAIATAGAFLVALAWSAHASRARRDLAWGAAVPAALLLDPLATSSSLVLVLFPLVLLLRALPTRASATWGTLLAGLALLATGPLLLERVASPGHSLAGMALLATAFPALGLLLLSGLCAALGRIPPVPFAR